MEIYLNPYTGEGWMDAEETIIAGILATETMHDPENVTGDRRIACSRIEAIRRMARRTVRGSYRNLTGVALKAATEPVSPEWNDTPARQAARLQSLCNGPDCSRKAASRAILVPGTPTDIVLAA